MSDTAEPLETVMESDSGIKAEPATTPPRASARGLTVGLVGREKLGAGAQAPSDAATLACAISIAVALGISCGVWINARLASAASVVPPAPARLLPDAHAAGQPVQALSSMTAPGDFNDTSLAADEATSLANSDEPSEAQRAHPSGRADDGSGSRLSAGAVKTTGGRGGASGVEAKEMAVRGQGRVIPCALYASAGGLTIRGGGVTTLVLGGPGEAGRVTVNTPDWSDIAVFSEGRAAGNNGWVRYSVRSVSKRAGVYTLRFTTPCGSKTVPVTVTRP